MEPPSAIRGQLAGALCCMMRRQAWRCALWGCLGGVEGACKREGWPVRPAVDPGMSCRGWDPRLQPSPAAAATATPRSPTPLAADRPPPPPPAFVQVSRMCQYMGDQHTNNQAEYAGLIAGLQAALELGCRRIQVQGDSTLIIRQVGRPQAVARLACWLPGWPARAGVAPRAGLSGWVGRWSTDNNKLC